MLSDADCRVIMELPVKDYKEISDKATRSSYNSRNFTVSHQIFHPIDTLINTAEFVERRVVESDSSEQISVMKRKTAIAKTALERDADSLKADIKVAEKALSDTTDRIGKIQADKRLKLLKNELRKHEDNLFMERMRLDLVLEEQIKELTSGGRFTAKVQRQNMVEIIHR